MAAIFDLAGNQITDGLQGCTKCDAAIQAAQRIADACGHDVQLDDDDGSWIVHPQIDGHREPADPVEG